MILDPLRTKPTHHEQNPGNPHHRNKKERHRLDNTNKLDELHFSLETAGQSTFLCEFASHDGKMEMREMELETKTDEREDKRMKMMLLESGD
jgi:myo-inositol catabolism protein IolC